MFGNPETTPGGRTKFIVRLEVRRAEQLKARSRHRW